MKLNQLQRFAIALNEFRDLSARQLLELFNRHQDDANLPAAARAVVDEVRSSPQYTVELWGSKPGTNDDCWSGDDFMTREEALAAYNAVPMEHGHVSTCTAWIVIDGPDIHEERQNPAFRPERDDADEWRREIEREHLMLHGSLDR